MYEMCCNIPDTNDLVGVYADYYKKCVPKIETCE